MSRSTGVIIAVILAAMVAGFLFLVMSGFAVYNFALRGERGSGRIEAVTREVGGFDAVSVCCGMQLTLEQGDSVRVQLEGDDNLLQRVTTTVEGDELVVKLEPHLGNLRFSRPVRALVTAPDIGGVDASGGSSVTASDLDVDSLNLSISGGGRATIGTLETDSFTANVTGGGKLNVGDGEVGVQSLKLTGGSNYEGGDLESESAEISISGGGEATLWATEELDINASGGSRVRYYGQPRIAQNTSGGSRVESLGER